jgi:RTX calcium-binding nonapeptide repeat (4 copies)/Galactose oxidase, central domain/Kelch motif
MTGTLSRSRQLRPVFFLVALLSLLGLGLAPQASAAGSGFFSPTGSMSVPRGGAVAAPLPDGRVLVAGGVYFPAGRFPPPATSIHYLSSAEVFDPATNAFRSAGIGSMSVPRAGAAAAPLPDGRVLVAGGNDPGVGELSSAEVFDPATNTFSSAGIGSMSVPRAGAAAAPLPDGRVLVAGGIYSDGSGQASGTSYLSSAEVFDPTTNTFSSAGIGSMTVPRGGAAAAPLPDGRVLVAGGAYFRNGPKFGPFPLSSAEVFNPATNSFSSAGIGSMTVPRGAAASAPLPDGRVLVAGGGHDVPTSAEIFDPASKAFSSAVGSMTVPRSSAAAAPLPDGRVLLAGGENFDDSGIHFLSSAEVFTPATCRGKQATFVGTDRADQITGTPGADVIVGLGGNDKLSGLAGRDVICGGDGKDTLKGGKGNDKLYGEAGKDTLKGGPGKDTFKGGAGKDKQVQ